MSFLSGLADAINQFLPGGATVPSYPKGDPRNQMTPAPTVTFGGVIAGPAAAAGATAGGASPRDILAAHEKAVGQPYAAPAEAAKGLVPSLFSPGGDLRTVAVWVVIVLVGLIGLWGLLAPGGGVAVIERLKR